MLNEILIFLSFSVVAVAIFKRLDFPSVLGYLLVGLLAGQHVFDLIHDSHVLEQIAEIGVVFLLFTIGLEVSIPKLITMRRMVFGIGMAQVVVSTLSTIAIGIWMGLSWQAAFAVGGALTMSSTAIVVKQLTEQHELHSLHGNISLGVLLFQDLAVVPFLVLIPLFALPGEGSLLLPMLIALGKGALAFAIIYYSGQHIIRPAVRKVAATRSSELFTLFILTIALLAAWMTWQMGLSLAMGAFLAGIMLAETEYQHHIEVEIRPFRDVLMGLFFISVGALFDWRVVINDPLPVLVLTVGLVAGKGIGIAILTRLAGYDKGTAMRSGVILGQGSEFGFALLGLALTTGLLDISLSQPIIAAIIFSMMISPFLIRNNQSLANTIAPETINQQKQAIVSIESASKDLSSHVIVCGFGRTGQNLALFLKEINIPFIAIELDTEIVREAWEAGDPVYYGESHRAEILQHAGIARAKVLVITFPEQSTSELIIRTSKSLNPDLPIVVRTRDDRNLEALLECGADEVIPDTVESSMMLAKHTLETLGEERTSIDAMLEQARSGHYARVRAFFHSYDDVDLDRPDNHHLHSIEILTGYHANGKAINSFQAMSHIEVIAMRRNGVRCEGPVPETLLKPGDILIIEGTPDNIQFAEIEMMSG